MNRMTIQQFRAAIADRAEQSSAMRAYRAITNDPRAALGRTVAEWMPWDGALATAGWVEWPDGGASADRQPSARLVGWGDWSGPPAHPAGA